MRSVVKKEIHIFFTALMFYTRIPCPSWVDHSEEYLNKSTRYFALVGWIVGGLSALVFWMVSCILPIPIAIILSMIASVWITGAFHEDGFADVCDGFGGAWKKEKILEIMKDSRSGAFAVVGISLIILLKYESLVNINPSFVPIALLAAHALSRFIASTFIYTLSYVREDMLSKAKPVAKGLKLTDLMVNLMFGCLPLIFFLKWEIVLIFVPLIAAWFYMSRFFKKWIGGYTGDCLGATQQVMEVIIYMGIAAEPWKFI